MKVDDILKAIGEFGPYQMKMYTMVCSIGVLFALNQLAHVFLSFPSDHWCDVPEWQQNYEDCQDLIEKNDEYLGCLYKYRNASIPIETEDGESYYSQCAQYDADYKEWVEGYYAGNETKATKECDGWIYDKSEYTRTIRTDYDLVCDKKTAADLAQSAWFLGVLVGSIVFGQLSDLIGRFYCFYICVAGLFTFCMASAFMPNYWSFVLVRSTGGMFNMGTYILAFVIGTELVGPSKRVLAGIVICIFCSIGYMLLPVLAYFIRDWRVFQLVIAAPISLFFLTIPFVTESVRWLMSQQRFGEAEDIIVKAARGNRKEDKLPEYFMKQLIETEEKENTSSEKSATMLDLFRTPRLRMTTINLMYNWFINSLVYYGLSLSTSDLGSNDYVAFFISGAVEIPAYILCVPLIESPLGRKYTTSGFELLGGVACLITIFLPTGAARTSIAMVGKFGISASFALIYIYSAELLPTPVRTVGVGICSLAARVSGIMAPFIVLLDEYWEPFPYLIFGSTCIVGALLLLFLPETRGKQLPESLAEGELFGMESKAPPVHVVNAEMSDVNNGEASPVQGESNVGYEDEEKI